MKILISTILSTKHKVGVTEYLIGLINAIQKIDNSNEYFILTTPENRKFFSLEKENFHEIVINIYDFSRIILRLQYLFFSKTKLFPLIKKHKIDVLHEPSSWFINKKINTVVTIHDIVELNNQKYSKAINYIKQKMILESIYYATKIISVSNSTANNIMKIHSRKVENIYNGFNGFTIDSNTNEISVLNKYHISRKKYMIFIGTLLKHKNLKTLLKAFKDFVRNNEEYKLVLAGKKGNAYFEIKKFIRKNSLRENVILSGYFNDEEKYPLIKNAAALLLVSREEGFGFPILEAQSIGVPVITSNISSMKEIANNSTILIDPTNYLSITEGMNKIISSPLEIDKIIELGYANIERFSWVQTAKKTIDVYKQAYLHSE